LSLKISFAGKSDRGLVREGNEDSFRIDPDSNLVMVCDGMGGHQAGEVASKDACDIISYCFSSLAEDLINDSALAVPAHFPREGDLLAKAIRMANRSIYIRSRSRSDFTGMGTTVVAAVLQGDLINIAHVGDSRIYRLTESGLVALTADHSWVSELKRSGQFSDEEAERMVGKNVITRALGVNERVEIDLRADKLHPGEIYILCTDGLCGYADDYEIYMAAKNCHGDINLIVDNLIQLANDHGGQDNVTIAAIRIDEVDGDPAVEDIKPVTLTVEGDDALLRENQIIEAMVKSREKTEQILIGREKQKKGAPLALIFALFIVIASLIIYLVSK